MGLNNTPRSNRLHIGIFGKRNSGKSTLINAVTQQQTAIVSNVAGTTADPVYKAMEINGIGACVIIDTAGFDDDGALGLLRVGKTKQAAEKTDVAVVLFSDCDFEQEIDWINMFNTKQTPCLAVINKIDVLDGADGLAARIKERTGLNPLLVSAETGEGIDGIRGELVKLSAKALTSDRDILQNLAEQGDVVMLVMPQDIQAPKGRLILPQAQVIRELLDKNCTAVCVTPDGMDNALSELVKPPKLIITDSQVFGQVFKKKPQTSILTSFSILFAAHKGDIRFFAKSAAAVEALTEQSSVLIMEACTHAPLEEDIGRVKIPRLLRNRVGEGLTIDVRSGSDFPDDLTQYDLIIHCGACMFNRKYVMSRVAAAKEQGVPMSNYGVILAYLTGILDKVCLPEG